MYCRFVWFNIEHKSKFINFVIIWTFRVRFMHTGILRFAVCDTSNYIVIVEW